MKRIIDIFKNNLKVVENYSAMTIMTFANIGMGIVTYPYLIRTLGSQAYGEYLYVMSFTGLFGILINFSFGTLATKEIVESNGDVRKKSEIVSSIIFARLFLFGISTIIFVLMSLFSDFVIAHFLFFLLPFLGNISSLLFHNWYFLGIQKMRIVTYISLAFQFISFPLIFLLIKGKDDLLWLLIISFVTGILQGLWGFGYLIFVEKIRVVWVGIPAIKERFRISLPFFYKSVLSKIRGKSMIPLLGTFVGMHEVAVFNLARKILKYPFNLTANINRALFPKVVENPSQKMIDKLLKYEWILGVVVVMCIAVFGKAVVLLFGGAKMSKAYYIALILSFNIFTRLLFGVYLKFVFVIKNRNELVFYHQLIWTVSYFVLTAVGLYFWHSVYVFAIAIMIARIVTLCYDHWNFRKIRREGGNL